MTYYKRILNVLGDFHVSLTFLICIILTLSLTSCGNSSKLAEYEETLQISEKEEHSFSCVYAEKEREYIEYAPEQDVKGILFMLHGYGSDAVAFRRDTKMDEDALKRGYVVVYVTGQKNDLDITSSNGWNSGIGNSTNDDIGFLKTLASYFQAKYKLSRNETFAAGFSNGAFMMYRIALEGSDTFAGAASVAGMMPKALWEQKTENSNISILQINGLKDDVVPMYCNDSAKYAQAPAMEDVITYFAQANQLRQSESDKISEKADILKYSETGRKEQVWWITIKEGRHSWPKEESCGFQTNQIILDFFDTVRSN